MVLAFELAEEKLTSQNKHYMAIVIDDLGNSMEGTQAIMDLNIPITVAIMPFMPSTAQDAEQAYAKGHEVIVHMPMEPNKGKKSWLGPGAITADLSDEEVKQRVEAAIDQVPHAVGMNNHMGSKITTNEHLMRIILQVCKDRGLYYLDSKTSHQSVVAKVANELGVTYIENNLFLDDVYTAAHIEKQMQKAFELLDKNQYNVMIGHVGAPGKYTSSTIKASIDQLQKRGTLLKVSQMIQNQLIDPEIL